jgi:hypothetical protein
MAKNEKTSARVATEASKVMKDPKSTKMEKSVAGSTLICGIPCYLKTAITV